MLPQADRRAAGKLDHVALWVSERAAIADILCTALGLHVIEETDTFTLVGADAREGKLTLFEAEGPREAGSLVRIEIRAQDAEAVIGRLPSRTAVRRNGGPPCFHAGDGLWIAPVPVDHGFEGDLAGAVLAVPDPQAAVRSLVSLGFEPFGDGVAAGGRYLRLVAGGGAPSERPLLNHLALLVESADAQAQRALAAGAEITRVKDAANTYAAFVLGPAGIELEYVEHKPGFALV